VKRLLASIFAVALTFIGLPVQADILTISQPFTVSANGATQHMFLGGQTGCTVTFASVGSGASFTVTGAADNVPTPATVTGIGTSGVIATPSAGSSYGGSIAPAALTQIWLVASSVTGTYTGTITCSPAFSGGGGGGGGGGGSGAPLAGGASGIATGANQAVAVAGYNGSTLDAIDSTSNALNVYLTNPSGGYSYTQGQTGSSGSFLGSACAYYLNYPSLSNSYINPLWCDVHGALMVGMAPVTTSTITSVAASTSSTTILASNTARRNFYVYNDSTATMYLAFAATASTTSYTFQLAPQQGYTLDSILYNGALSAVWSSATGNARITELTP
jgi:hypothetical protein